VVQQRVDGWLMMILCEIKKNLTIIHHTARNAARELSGERRWGKKTEDIQEGFNPTDIQNSYISCCPGFQVGDEISSHI
jgi:hypothetical protein